MRIFAYGCAAIVAASLFVAPAPVEAGGFLSRDNGVTSRLRPSSRAGFYRGRPQVRGYRRRVGGYSYARQDTFFFDVAPSIKYGVEPNYATEPSGRQ